MQFRHLMPCVALTLACLASHCLAGEASARSDPGTLLRSQGYRVTYEDEAGRAITAQEFTTRYMTSRSFSVATDSARKTALFKPASKAPPLIDLSKLAVKEGEPVAALSGTTLDGKTLTVPTGEGRYTLLAFFFSTCAPCVAEIPELNELSAAHPDVRVVGVTFDPVATTRKLAAKHGIQYTTLSDARDSINKLHIHAYPTLMLVKPDGTLAAVRSGGVVDNPAATQQKYELESWLQQQLARR